MITSEHQHTNDEESQQKAQQRNAKQKRQNRRRILHTNGQCKEVVNMRQGYRTLSIISLNPDDITASETRDGITEILKTNKMRLSSIQGTHIPCNEDYLTNGYRIITSDSKKTKHTRISHWLSSNTST